ncbi:hypothetical protein T10_8867 [Trichinella papuae]|uniref:Uncharacterized protein n=1 Tax=Trichinella papuae TaxID=268474 RepID=A0A0V1MT58_9BILA|nr:hypothetical protein T10_8867 [Trichinella papuae]
MMKVLGPSKSERVADLLNMDGLGDRERKGGEAELITNHVAAALSYRSIFGLEDQWRSTVGSRRNVAGDCFSVFGGNASRHLLLRHYGGQSSKSQPFSMGTFSSHTLCWMK